jgi:uroporphyrinogen-III synthase
MRLLVTRPEADSVVFKAKLIALGHEVVVDPLLVVRFDGGDDIEITGAQALIATSRNGLRALAAGPAFAEAKALPVYCVGPGTAETAKAIGLGRIVKGPADVAALIEVIDAHADVNGGPLIHLSGDVVAGDLAGELTRRGYHVLQPVVYRTEPARRFAAASVASLRNKRIDGIILLSPRTADVYAGLVASHNLGVAVKGLLHVCVSPATAARLAPLSLERITVAAAPNLQEVLALLAPAATQSGS